MIGLNCGNTAEPISFSANSWTMFTANWLSKTLTNEAGSQISTPFSSGTNPTLLTGSGSTTIEYVSFIASESGYSVVSDISTAISSVDDLSIH